MIHAIYPWGTPLELEGIIMIYPGDLWGVPLELDGMMTHLTYIRGILQPLELDGTLTHLIYLLENALQLDGPLIQ